MIKSILLPVDLNHDSSWEISLPHALEMAEKHGAKIHVLTVIPDYGSAMVGSFFPKDFSENAKTESEKSLKEFLAKNIPDGVSADAHVLHGTIYKEIIGIANKVKADMIIMAAQRPEMKDYFLGPNAARVVRHAKQSVMVVR